MKMLVLGAGLQGSACAYDLLQNPAVTEVRLADQRVDRLPAFLQPYIGGERLKTIQLDVKDGAAVAAAMQGVTSVMSALPYYLNFPMTEAAIAAGAHFSDLGGNTEIVQQQQTLTARAASAGVSVIPDCGLAPGMVNILAQLGIDRCDTVDAVRIYVGGLPQQPEGPLQYQIVYSIEGVLDYYTTLSWVIRGGKRTQMKALSELEPVTFEAPVGTLEAFHTAGGLSTMAFRYEGKIPTMEYKTLRYPGHAKIMEAIRELGLLELEPVTVKGTTVVPRDVAIAQMQPRLTKTNSPDLVALRVTVAGTKGGKPVTHHFELVDRYDAQHGISAMMRTTGYSLSITGQLQAEGAVATKGVHTSDECMPGERYVTELGKRGILIRQSTT
ncbi:MAG: saccharopine dehydrogenase C-terminal domain-containing protein [Gemmatimonadota bacterium]|jgi:lysine 6-dehydrogenase|nr:saccharopine dehydrogenase C-terminal domain-containing protein [Gemmatimonadota bacterium]MDQ8146611.1 saccharopine dehydrogenase C-terminal domain-containing protein [Gemmatimonadota bacterium]MDQ8148536.1 saccharopine dehydrogenase C-terminal domain-containing protein [Gemmatimonadota bacterium]MDQ8175965.1 saccharopine dehydrogenase C-terminal domain-containing protein [Gemmatimonadota bacterium]